jgi:hypothetical protein
MGQLNSYLLNERAQIEPYKAAWMQQANNEYQGALSIGWDQAKSRLQQHTDNLSYTEIEARSVIRQIHDWIDLNATEFNAIMETEGSDAILPEELQQVMGATELQQYVIAMYSEAARGLAPWLAAKQEDVGASPGELIEEAEARLEVFASIVRMDDDGDLTTLFNPEGLSGGMAVAVAVGVGIAVAILGVGITAVICRMKTNLAIIEPANERADKAAAEVQKCFAEAETEFELQKCNAMVAWASYLTQQIPKPETPLGEQASKTVDSIVKAAMLIGGGYLILQLAVPMLQQRRRRGGAVARS